MGVGCPLQLSRNATGLPSEPVTVKFDFIATVVASPSYGLKRAAPEIITPIVPRLVEVLLAAITGLVVIVKS